VFVYFTIGIFAFNPLNLHVFDSLGAVFKDIEFTDILFSDKNTDKNDFQVKISSDIVLVNAADRGRAEIAILLDKINEEKPAVVGVDFIFEGPKSNFDDSLLKAALARTSKLVLATRFKDNDEQNKSNYIQTFKELGKYKEGYANLMITSMGNTVRHFKSEDKNGDYQISPFSVEVVNSFNPKKAEIFKMRHADFELINYEGNLNAIDHFNGTDVITGNVPKGFFKNKIVLVGFFGSDCNPNPILDDNFYTPMNKKLVGRKFPDTYGIIIQANIINMILKESYIYKTPVWAEWVTGFFICFLHNFIFIRHYVHKHLWYHLYAKIIQLITTFLLVLVCIYLFKSLHIKISASPFIVPVLLTVDLLYFYDAFVKWHNKKYRSKTYFTTGPIHH